MWTELAAPIYYSSISGQDPVDYEPCRQHSRGITSHVGTWDTIVFQNPRGAHENPIITGGAGTQPRGNQIRIQKSRGRRLHAVVATRFGWRLMFQNAWGADGSRAATRFGLTKHDNFNFDFNFSFSFRFIFWLKTKKQPNTSGQAAWIPVTYKYERMY